MLFRCLALLNAHGALAAAPPWVTPCPAISGQCLQPQLSLRTHPALPASTEGSVNKRPADGRFYHPPWDLVSFKAASLLLPLQWTSQGTGCLGSGLALSLRPASPTTLAPLGSPSWVSCCLSLYPPHEAPLAEQRNPLPEDKAES